MLGVEGGLLGDDAARVRDQQGPGPGRGCGQVGAAGLVLVGVDVGQQRPLDGLVLVSEGDASQLAALVVEMDGRHSRHAGDDQSHHPLQGVVVVERRGEDGGRLGQEPEAFGAAVLVGAQPRPVEGRGGQVGDGTQEPPLVGGECMLARIPDGEDAGEAVVAHQRQGDERIAGQSGELGKLLLALAFVADVDRRPGPGHDRAR